ncbi:MAG: gamma-glutamyltransferase [Minwuia sp.]|nr:gamma-glutamyltransferase [Minwuia sp.]
MRLLSGTGDKTGTTQCRWPASAPLVARLLLTLLTLVGLFGASAQAELRREMVAAAHPLAAEAGMKMLARGGSAVDAAIAIQAMLTLVEPQSSGIGGGAFMLHMDAATGEVTAFDGRETAPKAVTADLFLDAEGKPLGFFEAVVGGRAVGVPGVLRMLEMAHRKHGLLKWADLFEPAIDAATNGFAITPRLHYLLARDSFLKHSEVAGRFYYRDGEPLPVGYQLRNSALARSLADIAWNGADALYRGPIAAAIVAAVQGHATNPGNMTQGDLARYEAKQRDAVCTPYRRYQVCGMPPPTSGGVTVAQILGQLYHLPIADAAPGSARAIHLISEAERRAYADRGLYLADSDFVDVPVDALLRPAYLKRRATTIDPERSSGPVEPGNPLDHTWNFQPGADISQPSTTHFSIIDRAGNVVSMTSSVENAFGSRLMVGGFLLNNQLTDFSFRPSDGDGRPVANRVEPGKRPRSSMSPTIVLNGDGSLRLAIGSPGGSRIIGYVAKTIVAVLDWGLDVQSAIDLPHHTNRNGDTDLELGTAIADRMGELTAMGHSIRLRTLNSGLHGIEQVDGVLRGGADPRREGVVLSGGN